MEDKKFTIKWTQPYSLNPWKQVANELEVLLDELVELKLTLAKDDFVEAKLVIEKIKQNIK